MEKDYGSSSDKSPESKWDFFEHLDDDDEKKDKDKPPKKWFAPDEDKEPEDKKPKKTAETDDKVKESKKPAEDKAKPSIVETEEFAKMTLEQKKIALAKEYVENRSEELQEELEIAPEGSEEALEISADLELIQALSDKLENPEVVAEDAVEEAYQQIMDRLDEIFNDNEVDEEIIPALEDTPDESEDSNDNAPSIFARPRSKKKDSKPAPSTANKRATDGGRLSPKPKIDKNHSAAPEFNGPKLKEVAPTSPFLARQRRTGNLAVSEATNQAMSRRTEQTPEVANIPELSKLPEAPRMTPEVDPSPIQAQTERFVNPIKRTVEEKERRVRQFATKHTLGERVSESIFESTQTPPSSEQQPPAPIESMRPVSYQERPTAALQTEKRVSREQSRDLAQSSTEQLLQIADKVRIDGATLRSLYASNQIDRNGLTKVIKEALKGGDVKSALSKATLGAEAQRGRKIEMRHDDPTFDDVKGYSQTTEAAKARTDRILESLDMVSQAKNATSSETPAPNIHDVKDQAMQRAEAASKKAKIAIVAVIALSATALAFCLMLIL
jgi:hypothetical protein